MSEETYYKNLCAELRGRHHALAVKFSNDCNTTIENILQKLNENQMNYCVRASEAIDIASGGLDLVLRQEYNKLHGYLDCLADMEILTWPEAIILLDYFAQANRAE